MATLYFFKGQISQKKFHCDLVATLTFLINGPEIAKKDLTKNGPKIRLKGFDEK